MSLLHWDAPDRERPPQSFTLRTYLLNIEYHGFVTMSREFIHREFIHMPIALTSKEKIALFRSLFSGRADVFSQHWISRDNKKQGWFPVHTDRTNVAYLPLTDAIIENHLRGNRTVGLYPLLTDNTSWLVAADFDGANWQKEVNAIILICKEYNLPTYVERSRSGNGAHVWCFFENAYPAYKSRVIFLHLLKLSNVIDALDGEQSFDRIFPNQDYLSGKGLGNLIALPLQGAARKQGNTVFLDSANGFAPYPDQWLLLQSIERITTYRLDELYSAFIEQKKTGRIVHYVGSEMPITIGEHLTIPKSFIFKELADFLGERLNFFNVEYAVKQRMGLPTFGTERYFKTIEKDDENILIPRGFLSQLLAYLNEQKISFALLDQRFTANPIKYLFSCKLFDYQTAAVNAFNNQDAGILVAPPGSGKTIMGLALVAKTKQPTLILVHRKQIANQWMERVEHFFNIPKKKIGQLVSNKKKVQLPITVAMVQSLARLESLDDLAGQFGTVIVDECHHMPAKMFRQVITKLRPHYLYGLTATPNRKHNDERLIFIYLGDIIHEVKEPVSNAVLNKVTFSEPLHGEPIVSVVIRGTTLSFPFKISTRNYQLAIKALCFDTARNEQIVDDVIEATRAGKKCLVLTERKEHVELLTEYLKRDFEIIAMTGNMSASKKKEKERQILSGHFQIIFATGQLVGEGVHFPHLDELFLIYPFSFEGKLTQYVGRILHSDSKAKKIHDYCDELVPYFDRMFKKRQKYYDKHYPPIIAKSQLDSKP